MSLRNIRKIYGNDQLPSLEDHDDFEPAYAQKLSKSLYEGLVISSNSDGDVEDLDKDKDKDVPETPKAKNVKKRKNKKKRKQRHNNQNKDEAQALDELDEIDRSLIEVNALLGEPEEPPKVIPHEDHKKKMQKLFTIRPHFFAADSELTRKFGPDEDEDPKKRGRQPNLRLISQNRCIIKTDKLYKKNGLSMDLVKRQDDLIFFAFKHSKDYQHLHSSFIYMQQQLDGVAQLDESQRRMHVEGLLEFADRLYYMERYLTGNKVIEEIICYMQQCAHPFFSVTDIRVRLLYKHVENRAFHIALLKYLHMLTNRACHRTALELAKLLLNLDPSDPLAVLFIIDTIAIRAGEYEWLIEAIEYWSKERDAGFLFNMMYSLALAEFHLSRKAREEDFEVIKEKPRVQYQHMKAKWDLFNQYSQRKENKSLGGARSARISFRHLMNDGVGYGKADRLLTNAMLQFPSVVVEMMKIAGIRNEKITSCPLFKSERSDRSSSKLKSLITLYARFIWHKFLEESVMKWFIRNATTLVDDYNSDPHLKAVVEDCSLRRMNLFQTYPSEILRHLSIITPLSNLIVEGAVPEIENVSSYDPEPPLNGINVYERQANAEGTFSIIEFLTSMMPDHELMDAGMDLTEDLPRVQGQDLLPDPAPVLNFSFPSESESEEETESETADHISLVEAIEPHPAQQNVQPAPAVSDTPLFTNTIQNTFQPPTTNEINTNQNTFQPPTTNETNTNQNNFQPPTTNETNTNQNTFQSPTANESNTNQNTFQPPTNNENLYQWQNFRHPIGNFRNSNVQGSNRNHRGRNPQRQGYVVFAQELHQSDEDNDSDVILSFETTVYTPRNPLDFLSNQTYETDDEQTTESEENFNDTHEIVLDLEVETKNSNDDDADDEGDDEGNDGDNYDDEDVEVKSNNEDNDHEGDCEEDASEGPEEDDNDDDEWTDIDSDEDDYQDDEEEYSDKEEDVEQEDSNQEDDTQEEDELDSNYEEDDQGGETGEDEGDHNTDEHGDIGYCIDIKEEENVNNIDNESEKVCHGNLIHVRVPPGMSQAEVRLALSRIFGTNNVS